MRALVGRKNGRGGGPRIMTILADRMKVALGLDPAKRCANGSPEADAVKFGSVDLFFAEGHAWAA